MAKVTVNYICEDCQCRFAVVRGDAEIRAGLQNIVAHCPDCACPDNVVPLDVR